MKLLKKTVSLLLAISIFISIFTGCSTFNLNNVEAAITKAEWIENLGRYFGMDDYQSKTPLFKDLTMEDSVYPYAQSCAEWNVIAQSGTFDAEKKITKEYALATCVYGLGAEKTGISIDNSSTKEAAEYAYENGIAQSKSWTYMHQGVTIEEAETFLTSTIKHLSSYLYPQYNNSKYSNKVKIPANTEKYTIDAENETVIFENADDVEKYSVGDVLALDYNGIETPVKISNIDFDDGKAVLAVESPTAEEIYETIDFSNFGTVANASDIQVYDGVELDSFKTKTISTAGQVEPKVENLGSNGNQTGKNRFHSASIGTDPGVANNNRQAKLKQTWIGDYDESTRIDVADFSFKVAFKNGGTPKISVGNEMLGGALSSTATIDPKGNSIKLDELKEWAALDSIPDDKYEAVKKMGEPKWVKGSYEITGKVEIKDFYIQASAKGNVFDFGGANIKLDANFTVETSLEFKGKVSIDKNLGDIPIRLGSTPFKLVACMAIVGELGGSVKITCSVSQHTAVEYSHGKLQKHTDKDFSKSIEFKGKLEFNVGPRIRLAIGILKWNIDIANVTFTIGASITAKATWTNVLKCSDGNNYRLGGDENKEEVQAAGISFEKAALVCTDVEFEFPIVKLSFCDDPNTLLNKVGASFDLVIVGKKGLVKIGTTNWHWENFEKVKNCSLDSMEKYKFEEEKEDETTSAASEDNQNGFKTGYLDIDSYAINVVQGNSAQLNITALPENASIEDVTLSVDDASIASATRNGTAISITGLAEGTTVVNVSCGDKQLQCMVMVTKD